MVDVSKETLVEAEDMIRDLINYIEVLNKEEVEGDVKKIEDDAATKLTEKLRQIAQKIAGE